jgi:aminopeptidase
MDLTYLAPIFINDALMIKENEVIEVTLTGEKDYFTFLDEFTLDIAKRGAFPTIRLNTPSYRERYLRELPETYLSRTPPQALNRIDEFTRHINIICNDPDPTFKNISQRKYHAARDARKPVVEKIKRRNMSEVHLPTRELAEYFKVPDAVFIESMHSCLNIPYRQLRKDCKAVAKLLKQPKKMVKLLTGNEHELTFQLSDRPVFSEDGTKNLPAGYVFLSPEETSVNGSVLIETTGFNGKQITNLVLTFKDGRIESSSADKNIYIFGNRISNTYGDKDVFAGFGIGLNPGVQQLLSCDIIDPLIRGSVHICVGSNLIFGGNNFSDIFWPMTIVHPTVFLGKRPIIEKGVFTSKLKL